MRHATRTQRLGRPLASRKSLLRHLVSGLVRHERITTTVTRAKATQRLADHLITWGKEGGLAARRQVFDVLQDRTLTKRLFAEVAPLFQERHGGYTRVVRLRRRRGDGAALALLELVAHTAAVAPKTPAASKHKKGTASPTAPGVAATANEQQAPASPPASSAAAAADAPQAASAKKPKRFLEGLRDLWRRKKTDE